MRDMNLAGARIAREVADRWSGEGAAQAPLRGGVDRTLACDAVDEQLT